MTEFGNKLSLY